MNMTFFLLFSPFCLEERLTLRKIPTHKRYADMQTGGIYSSYNHLISKKDSQSEMIRGKI